jgi:hypothetical protein
MDFYVSRILFPALPIDVVLTIGLFYLLKNSVSFKRKRRVLSSFAPAPLYFVAAVMWTAFYSLDMRFQGQGVLGLFMLMFLGMGFTCFRLLIGAILFVAFRY